MDAILFLIMATLEIVVFSRKKTLYDGRDLFDGNAQKSCQIYRNVLCQNFKINSKLDISLLYTPLLSSR